MVHPAWNHGPGDRRWHSYGGRLTSMARSPHGLVDVLTVLYPLHPPGKSRLAWTEHLRAPSPTHGVHPGQRRPVSGTLDELPSPRPGHRAGSEIVGSPAPGTTWFENWTISPRWPSTRRSGLFGPICWRRLRRFPRNVAVGTERSGWDKRRWFLPLRACRAPWASGTSGIVSPATAEQFDIVIVGAGFRRDRRGHPAQTPPDTCNFVILIDRGRLGGTWRQPLLSHRTYSRTVQARRTGYGCFTALRPGDPSGTPPTSPTCGNAPAHAVQLVTVDGAPLGRGNGTGRVQPRRRAS